jgi:hypothetical protein
MFSSKLFEFGRKGFGNFKIFFAELKCIAQAM